MDKYKLQELEGINSEAIVSTLEKIEKEDSGQELELEQIINNNSDSKKIIEVKDLVKTFKIGKDSKEVLKGISFDIYEKENVAILGGNGAGKTTLVEIIVGLNKPTDGEINYNYEYKNSFLEEIGIQFQDSSYPPGISVKNVVDFVIDVFKVNISKEELNSLIKIFGIDSFYKKRANSLSGGQQQRINALLAIIQKPKVIFLDELSTGLDISIRTRIREFIKKYAEEHGMTIVLVSHDMGEIEYMCDRIIFLHQGKIVVNCSKEEIIEKFGSLENFVTTYING